MGAGRNLAKEFEVARLTPVEIELSRVALIHVLGAVESFCDGELTAEDLVEGAVRGPDWTQIWIIMGQSVYCGVCVTEFVQYPRFRALRITALAGSKFNEWKHYEAVLESFANANLCRRIEAYARPGMAKMLLKEGYRETRRIVLKDTFGGFH